MIIEFTGIDGSGKSTQMARVMRWASESGVPCYERILRSTGRRILGAIAAGRGHKSWSGLFDPNEVELATSLEVVQLYYSLIAPIDSPNQIILTDTFSSYWMANALSKGATNGEVLSLVYRELPSPALCLRMDCHPDRAFERILHRRKGDHILRHGGKQRLEQLRDALLDVSGHLPYEPIPVSTEISEEETFRAVRVAIVDRLKSGFMDLSKRLSVE